MALIFIGTSMYIFCSAMVSLAVAKLEVMFVMLSMTKSPQNEIF